MAKVWLRDRWELLLPLLERLTANEEEEIARICAEEIEYWRSRPTMKSLSSLKEPMSDTRKEIEEKLPLTDKNSYVNQRTGRREHIALKHMNYSEQEWAAMNAPSDTSFQERSAKLLDHPDTIVAKAGKLLTSERWEEIVVALAVVTGRRLAEVLKSGMLSPKTLYSVFFAGQLKRKDAVLAPYEIPTLVEAQAVLSAWQQVRALVDCSQVEIEQISVKYGPAVAEAANRHFADLVPVREGKETLYTHLFRAVYARIAVYYYCPPTVIDLDYMATIQGHYWVMGTADQEKRRNYASTLHYNDYRIGDGQGNIDGRQGIKLSQPSVLVIDAFRPKEKVAVKPHSKKGSKGKMLETDGLTLEKTKSHTIVRVNPPTGTVLGQIHGDMGNRYLDDTMALLAREHYVLQQITTLLAPLYEQLGADTPLAAVQVLLSEGSAVHVDQKLAALYHTSLVEVVDVLEDASHDHAEPVQYLRELLEAKRTFRKSYEKRHVGKDYSKMSLTSLRKTKTPEASQERYRRAVEAIMAYNDQAIADSRWFINAAVIKALVGGRGTDAKDYLETRQDEIDAHHQKYGITLGYNRRPVPVEERITVPEWPEGESTAEATDEGPQEEE